MSSALSQFDSATAVTPLDDGTRFAVELDPAWTIGARPHGGYLQATIARAADAARAASDHLHPLATSTQFLRSPSTGPAEVVTQVLRTGRSVSAVRATLHQDGIAQVTSLFTFGTLHRGAPPIQLDEPLADIPPIEACLRVNAMPAEGGLTVGIAATTNLYLDPATMAVPGELASRDDTVERPAVIQGWIDFEDGRPHDPSSLLYAVDVSPPTTFTIGIQGWVPTLELTTYVRGLPAPGPLRFRQRSRLLQDGLIDELCDIWDAPGRLVAQSSQLAMVRVS